MCADFHSEISPDFRESYPTDGEHDLHEYREIEREQQQQRAAERDAFYDEDEHTRDLYYRGEL